MKVRKVSLRFFSLYNLYIELSFKDKEIIEYVGYKKGWAV